MDSVKILESLIDSGAVDSFTALEVLKEMHQRGVINLVKHFNELNIEVLSSGTPTIPVLKSVVERINVVIDLLPSVDDEVIAPIDESQSVADIMGER